MQFASTLLLLSALIPITLSKTAIRVVKRDLEGEDFTCIKGDNTGFIGEAWNCRSSDSTGFTDIKNARKNGFERVDGIFLVCFVDIWNSECDAPAVQMQSAITQLAEQGAMIDMLWIDIDSSIWQTSINANRESISAMVFKAKAMGQKVGLRADQKSFGKVFGADYTAQSGLPLWWTATNGHADLNSFVPFNGFTTPLYHEYTEVPLANCGYMAESVIFYA